MAELDEYDNKCSRWQGAERHPRLQVNVIKYNNTSCLHFYHVQWSTCAAVGNIHGDSHQSLSAQRCSSRLWAPIFDLSMLVLTCSLQFEMQACIFSAACALFFCWCSAMLLDGRSSICRYSLIAVQDTLKILHDMIVRVYGTLPYCH